MNHPFDEAVALTATATHRYAGATHPGYANMVGPFGGITAATLLQGVMQHPQRLGEPVALTVNFAGPVADGPFELQVEPARTNRSTQHWVMALTQEEGTACTATAITAVRRPTWSALETMPPQGIPSPDSMPRLQDPGYPAWTGRYDMRYARGEFAWTDAGTEQADSDSVMWLRDDPPRPLDFAALAALCDAFLPRIYVRRRRHVPAGTVSITSYFHVDSARLSALSGQHVLATAKANNFANGYFDHVGAIYAADGGLLASTHQIVYYRE